MLNFFYIYGVIWTLVLFLYNLGWSDYCIPLDSEITTFFVVTIIISFVIGFIFRKSFRFRRLKRFPKRKPTITIVIVLFSLLEYVVCRQIPLIGIIQGSSIYTSFTGIPTLHVINSTLASFYAQYLFYLFLCFKKRKRLLLEYASLLFFVHLLEFNRGGLLISVFISAVMFFSSIARKIKFKHILLGFIFMVVVLYVFGGLGNLREAGSWDFDYLGIYGGFNSKFPSWLPNQFKWPYLYLVCSLWNLSYIYKQVSIDNLGFVSTFIPDFLTKRLIPDLGSRGTIDLLVVSFTTYSGYGTTLFYGGVSGMYVKFIFLIGINGLILAAVSKKPQLYIPSAGIIAGIVAMFFFTNTISFSAISFPIAYPILLLFYNKKRVRKKKRKSIDLQNEKPLVVEQKIV